MDAQRPCRGPRDELHPFVLGARALASLVQADAERYRRFLGLPAGTPVEVA